MKVLIIEDDPVAADYLSKALRESSHVTDVVEDGARGLDRALHEHYDALIVDRLRAAFPDHAILSEEGGSAGPAGPGTPPPARSSLPGSFSWHQSKPKKDVNFIVKWSKSILGKSKKSKNRSQMSYRPLASCGKS